MFSAPAVSVFSIRSARALAPALALLLAACGGGGVDNLSAPCATPLSAGLSAPAPDAGDASLQIVNDAAALSSQVQCTEQAVPITAGQQKAKTSGDSGNGVHLTLMAEVASPRVVGRPEFLGGTLDDLSAGGAFTGDGVRVFNVEIDGIGDSFRWSDDGGATWFAELIPIDGTAQPLADGVTVAFDNLTGHEPGDAWRVEAGVLQASSVDIKGDTVIVSYNTAGATRLGGIQVFHMEHGFPVLTSQALFRDADVHAVSASGGTAEGSAIYGAGAARKDTAADPAMLERIRLVGTHMTLDGHARMDLPSYAATGVTSVHAGILYAASGSTGGLTVIDDQAFAAIDHLPYVDARWLAGGTHTLGLLAGGTLALFDVTNQGGVTATDSFAVAGTDVPEAKNTVELAGDTGVVAAGPAGVQVLDLADGALLAELPVPVGATLDPADSVANAATVDNDVMFVSFGGAGIYAARADRHFDKPHAGPITLTTLGRLDFGDAASANHVAYKANYLYVAAGLGGLKIVRVACDPS